MPISLLKQKSRFPRVRYGWNGHNTHLKVSIGKLWMRSRDKIIRELSLSISLTTHAVGITSTELKDSQIIQGIGGIQKRWIWFNQFVLLQHSTGSACNRLPFQQIEEIVQVFLLNLFLNHFLDAMQYHDCCDYIKLQWSTKSSVHLM